MPLAKLQLGGAGIILELAQPYGRSNFEYYGKNPQTSRYRSYLRCECDDDLPLDPHTLFLETVQLDFIRIRGRFSGSICLYGGCQSPGKHSGTSCPACNECSPASEVVL